MTFLNPLLLFGLAAAALPLLIHLLNLRKLKTVQFSSLRFLKELQKTQIRRFKIRQLLLLLIRTLLIIMIVIAFSRPAVEGSMAGGIGTRAATTMVILLDDSPSMGVRNEKGIKLLQAKRKAEEILSMREESDQVYFIRLSDIILAESTTPHPSDATPEAIRNSAVSQVSVPFHDGLRTAGRILAGSGNPNREIFFLSDGQLSQFAPVGPDSVEKVPDGSRLFFVRIPQPDQAQNSGISSITTDARVISPEKPFPLDVSVKNGSDIQAEDLIVSLYLNGARVAQQSLTLEGGQTGSAPFRIIPRERGIMTGYAEIDRDALDTDDRRYFVLDIPERISIALVGDRHDIRHTELALAAIEGTGGTDFLAVEKVDEVDLASVDFSRFDVILLCNISDLTATEGDRIAQFVTGGGGLMFFPGPSTDCASINDRLFKPLGLPRLEGCGDGEEGRIGFEKIDLTHGLFLGLFDEETSKGDRRGIESPRIDRHVKISPGLAGNNLIELQNGSPFLIEYQTGAGRIFLFAVDAGTEWSDFPLRSLFAPLMHRSMVYLAARDASGEETTVGSPVLFRLRLGREAGDEYRLLTPEGISERVDPQINPVTGLTTFRTRPARTAGHYAFVRRGDGNHLLGASAANPDPRETELRVATPEEIRERFAESGIPEEAVFVVSSEDEMARVVTESRSGVELWKHFMIAAIFLAFCEMAVARFAGEKSRKGDDR